MKLLHVVGTRPNFMKAAPIMAAVERWNAAAAGGLLQPRFEQVLVHTGQHYDREMSAIFFEQLDLPEPDVYLGVGSGSQAAQTARLMLALDPVLQRESPDLVVVVGDVNSTLAAALVAVKEDVAVAHVEAGLRSGDRSMPEEINRILTDRVSRLLFTTSVGASEQLRREDVDTSWAHFVGNTMIDCLEVLRGKARRPSTGALGRLGARGYVVVTLHRPSNVDNAEQLTRLCEFLRESAQRLPVVFPVHARTAERLHESGLWERLRAEPRIHLLPPAGYLDFLGLVAEARMVLTDSGGIQAETCVMGTPCLTLRTTTEWAETVMAGVNRLVDPHDPMAALRALDEELARPLPVSGTRPELWDGHAAERIVAVIAEWAAGRRGAAAGA